MVQSLLHRCSIITILFLIAAGLSVNLHPALFITDYLHLHPSIERLHLDDVALGLTAMTIILLITGISQTRRLYTVSLRLRKHQSRHKLFLEKLPFAALEFDSGRRPRLSNQAYQQLSHTIGKVALEQLTETLFTKLNEEDGRLQADLKQFYPDNEIHNENSVCIEWLLQKTGDNYLLLGRDISQQQDTLSRLSISERILENTPIGVMVTGPDKTIHYANQAFQQVTGYSPEEVQGQSPSLLSSGKHESDFYKTMYYTLAKDGHWQGEIWNRRKNGDIYLEWLSIIALKDDCDRVSHFIAMFSEITAQEIVREKLRTLAYYDALTGLANRALLNDQLNRLTQKQGKKKLCLIFIDIDDFKRINDSLGHQIGDQLLIAFASRLKQNSRDIDIVARWGGDEFIIAIKVSECHRGISKFCNKHLNSLKQPFMINGRELSVTASMGVSVYGDDANNASELIRNADIAMFQSKKRGKNRFEIFSRNHHEELLENIEIENRLRQAIRDGMISVHFQPQINTDQNRIFGLEALARWHDEDLGHVPPQKFIRIAEDTGMINELSNVIFSKALQKFRQFQHIAPELLLSVNLSASQLQDESLATSLKEVTESLCIDPSHIKLEITEDILMSDIQRSMHNTSLLKEMGFRISLDDFGTGYSSLSYLKDFDIDEIKIDRSFVSTINSSERNNAIVSAIIAMSQALHIGCIIEGVESEEQLSELQKIGSTRYQGYLFYKPMPAEEILQLLHINH